VEAERRNTNSFNDASQAVFVPIIDRRNGAHFGGDQTKSEALLNFFAGPACAFLPLAVAEATPGKDCIIFKRSYPSRSAAPLGGRFDRHHRASPQGDGRQGATASDRQKIVERARHLGAYLQATQSAEERERSARHGVPEAVLAETAVLDFLYA
jgi:hypothetical protein